MLSATSAALASRRLPVAGQAASTPRVLVIVNDDFGAYQLASENWAKYPSTVRALTQNPIDYAAPHALEGGVPAPFSEFDGGFELVYLLRDPQVRVVGVTTQYGIASAPDAFTTASQVVRAVRRDDRSVPRRLPILRGARDAGDLGRQTPASRFIDREVMSHCGQIEILDTAPLTNTATALIHQPRLSRCWKRLWFVTGEFTGRLPGVVRSDISLSYGADFNINADSHASRYVLAHGGAFPIIPNELMDDTWMNGRDYRRLTADHSSLATFVVQENRPFYEHYFVDKPNPDTGPSPDEPGIMFHGAIGAAFAFNHGFSKGVTLFHSAVVMRWAGRYKQWVFALSSSPRLPKHSIYAQLSSSQAQRLHNAILSSLR